MAVAFDARTTVTSNSGTTLGGTHTPAGTPSLVLLKFAYNSVTGVVSGTPTYAAQAMTLVAGPIGGTNVRAYIYKLENPPAGAQLFNVALSNANRPRVVTVETYTGTLTASALDTAADDEGNGTAVTVDADSTSGDLVTDLVVVNKGIGTPTLTPGAGQTERWESSETGGDGVVAGGSTEPAVGDPTTMSWTISASRDWSIIAVSIIGASLQNATIDVTSASGFDVTASLYNSATVDITSASGFDVVATALGAAEATIDVTAASGFDVVATAEAVAAPSVGAVPGSPYIPPYSLATFGSGTPPIVYLALMTIPVAVGSGGLEVPFSNGYARQPIANDFVGWTAFSAGVQQTSTVNFDEVHTSSWGVIVGWSLWDDATAGNMLAHGLFGYARTADIGKRFMVSRRNLTLMASYATATSEIAEIIADNWTGYEGAQFGTEWGVCQTCNFTVPVRELRLNPRYGWQCITGTYGIGCWDGWIQRDEILYVPPPGEGTRRSVSPTGRADDDDFEL